MRRLAALPALLGIAACATAGDWRTLSPSALAGSPDYASRADRPDFHLTATGDFDGDGKSDHAELRRHVRQARYALFVRFADGRDVRLIDGNAAELPRIGVSTVPPGSYRAVCGKQAKADQCLPELTLANAGIALFTFENPSRIFYWTDGAFASEWMSE